LKKIPATILILLITFIAFDSLGQTDNGSFNKVKIQLDFDKVSVDLGKNFPADSTNSILQSKDSININRLYGVWYFTNTYPIIDTLTFKRTSPDSLGRESSKIEIYENGNFAVVKNYGRCGANDSNSEGKWIFYKDTQLFETTIPIAFRNKKYKVGYLSTEILILKKQ